MTPSEIITKLLYDTRTTQREFADALGYNSQGTVSNRLKRGKMNMSTFDEMLMALGYEIVVRPVGSKDREKEIVVTIEK